MTTTADESRERDKGGMLSLFDLDNLATREGWERSWTKQDQLLYEILREAIVARQQRSMLINLINERLVIES